jgi:hypothetical protein
VEVSVVQQLKHLEGKLEKDNKAIRIKAPSSHTIREFRGSILGVDDVVVAWNHLDWERLATSTRVLVMQVRRKRVMAMGGEGVWVTWHTAALRWQQTIHGHTPSHLVGMRWRVVGYLVSIRILQMLRYAIWWISMAGRRRRCAVGTIITQTWKMIRRIIARAVS